MKILFWCEGFLPRIGGIEILVSQLAQTLVSRGHACEIITNRHAPDLPANDTHHGAVVHRLDFAEAMRRRSPREMHRLCQQVRVIRQRFCPAVNHIFLSGPIVVLMQMTNRAPAIPIVTSLQTPTTGVLSGGSVVRRLLKESSFIAAANDSLKQGVIDLVPETRKRAHRLPHSVLAPRIAPNPLPMEPPVLLCLGRLAAEKGFDVALRALSQLDERWRDVRMIITGDGEERFRLEALSRELGQAKRVHFAGAIANQDVAAMLNKATLVLVPSRWQEPFPIICLEAGMMARPVVASRVGGIPELVEDGETGLLVEPEKPEALARSIETLLGNHERLHAMGARAKRCVMDLFGFEAYAAKHLEWYSAAAAAASPGFGLR
jgi:glycogen(starch) synthase